MNKNTKRLKSMSRLTGRYETGGIRKVVLDAPSPYSPASGSKFYKATANTDLEYEWVNGRGYTDRRDDNVIGSSHRHQRSTGGDIEYVLIAGGGGGRHGGGGAGGVFGNGPLTPSPLRNTADFGPTQFTGYSDHNTVGPVSRNMSGGIVGIVSSISDSLSIGAKGTGVSGSDSTFHSRTANGGGGGGAASSPGANGGSGGGGGRGPTTGGTGSQGGNGGSAFNPRPAGWSAGGGGDAGGNSSNPQAGPGITILVPGSPEAVCGGGAGGNGAPGPSYCSGNQRPDGYCYGSFVPGAATPGCPTHPTGGGGGNSASAPGKGAGGGGYPQPNSPNSTSGGDGVAYFKITENILK